MILHIKPTAKKDQVFRFKSNFIRFFKLIETPAADPKSLLDGIGPENDGISETIQNITAKMDIITKIHTKACTLEIKLMLENAAKELNIPLD